MSLSTYFVEMADIEKVKNDHLCGLFFVLSEDRKQCEDKCSLKQHNCGNHGICTVNKKGKAGCSYVL